MLSSSHPFFNERPSRTSFVWIILKFKPAVVNYEHACWDNALGCLTSSNFGNAAHTWLGYILNFKRPS